MMTYGLQLWTVFLKAEDMFLIISFAVSFFKHELSLLWIPQAANSNDGKIKEIQYTFDWLEQLFTGKIWSDLHAKASRTLKYLQI